MRYALLLIVLFPNLGIAQSRFEGTWKIDIGTLPMSHDTLVWLLQDGIYHCRSCVPPIQVKADGKDHRTPGQPYDTISVTIIDDRTIELVEKKDGHTVSDETFRVSEDLNTVTDEFSNWKVIMTRVEKSPNGSHAVSGVWRPVKRESISDKELLVTYHVDGETFSMSRASAEAYAAKLDGTLAPYRGNPGINGVSLKRINTNTIEQTDELDGKPINVVRMTVAMTGKSMTVVVIDVKTRTTTRFVALKQ
jgi:hypothetical protein